MAHHAPYECPPPRAGRHCTPAGPPLSPRQARRALRLAATAGSWVAGLCLIIGLIAVVITVTKPGGVAASAAADTHANPGAGARPSGAGHGGRSPAVTTRLGVAWRLHWSYRCAGPAGPGYLEIRTAAGGSRLARRGPSGAGVIRSYRSAGQYRITVSPGCSWQIRVSAAP